MKEKAVKVTNKTKQVIENAYEVLAMASAIAASVKVASEPTVTTGAGVLPIWQVVSAVLVAGVAYKVFQLLNKER